MLTTLLPVRIAPIIRSRVSSRRLTSAARRFPVFSMRSMRARENAVSAVSLPEKKNESQRQSTMTMSDSQSSMLIDSASFSIKKARTSDASTVGRDEARADRRAPG